MKYPIIISIILVYATLAYARLDETPDECDHRYSSPIMLLDPIPGKAVVEKRSYLKSDIRIDIEFQKEEDGIVRANIVIYAKQGNITLVPLTSTEMHTFLNANSMGFTWEEQDLAGDTLQDEDSYTRDERIRSFVNTTIWLRSDKQAFAVYTKMDNVLLIGTTAGEDRYTVKSDKRLEGF